MSNEGRHIRTERSMKIQPLLLVLTILNALLLVILFAADQLQGPPQREDRCNGRRLGHQPRRRVGPCRYSVARARVQYFRKADQQRWKAAIGEAVVVHTTTRRSARLIRRVDAGAVSTPKTNDSWIYEGFSGPYS